MTKLRVAVVTPYFREAESVLRQCHDSVRAQTYPCRHFMIADGYPQQAVSTWDVEHNLLSRSHDDCGNTPRSVGSICAASQGFHAIAYLDADNWFQPTHIETMLELHRRTGAVVCTAGRSIHRLDGSLMIASDRHSDGRNHVDTSCILLMRPAFAMIQIWTQMPRELSAACDRVFWGSVVVQRFARAHSHAPTVAYRTPYSIFYEQMGEAAPPEGKSMDSILGAMTWWAALPDEQKMHWLAFLSRSLWMAQPAAKRVDWIGAFLQGQGVS